MKNSSFAAQKTKRTVCRRLAGKNPGNTTVEGGDDG